ncbi:hypothetical protein VTJ49DRAFT_5742 [Mycothermus thermophilus]|uniref:Heterokaryon incompatibility domain-containing protein n=1 Tax=Humicola insolens TaxID=85995 RepID=A0ABR3V2N8_HUMIN
MVLSLRGANPSVGSSSLAAYRAIAMLFCDEHSQPMELMLKDPHVDADLGLANMRRFIRQHLRNSDEDSLEDPAPTAAAGLPASGPSEYSAPPMTYPDFGPTATAPGPHVCSGPLCEQLSALPAEYHESVIAQLTQQLGGVTPDSIRIEKLTMSNPRLVPEGTRDTLPETEERRMAEFEPYPAAGMGFALPTAFKYPPLPQGHSRFLRTVGSGTHPLCYLESHPLSNPPPYVAVSYCWDPASPPRGMFVNRESLSVSETVLGIINQMQAARMSTGEDLLLWIDQVCINQADPDEKLDQIYRMGDIYARAERVLIWLGPTADRSDEALEGLPLLRMQLRMMTDRLAACEYLPENAAEMVNAGLGQITGRLFARPWFRRLWTVQEAMLARKRVVVCGYRDVDFDMFAEVAREVMAYGSLDVLRYPGGPEDTEVVRAIESFIALHALSPPEGASLEERLEGLAMMNFRVLVEDARHRMCTEPIDRVHALMGLAPPEVRDYMAKVAKKTQDKWELYAEFAKCMLENDHELRFLSTAPSNSRPPTLPSFIPNLLSPPVFTSPLHATSVFCAGFSPETQFRVHDRDITTKKLLAPGFRLDIVAETVPQTAFTEASYHNRTVPDLCANPSIRDWEESCRQVARRAFNLTGPDEFPRHHIDVLLAQPAAAAIDPALQPTPETPPGTLPAAVQAYRLFQMSTRIRDEVESVLRAGIRPIPQDLAHLEREEAIRRAADRTPGVWQQGLEKEENELLLRFVNTMSKMCFGRVYFRGGKRILGLACSGAQVGDVVCILYGAAMPFVLRPRADGTMELVGDAYVNGFMTGEAIHWEGRGPDEMFDIR